MAVSWIINGQTRRYVTAELIDQRIIKAYGDGQSMMVSLLLSTDEVDGALKYFDGKK